MKITRRCGVLLLLAVVAQADELATARAQIAKYEVESRRAAIKTLVRLNNRAALDVLIAALRRSYREAQSRFRAYEKVMTAATVKISQLTDKLEEMTADVSKLQKQMKEITRLSKEAAKESKKAAAATEKLAPHLVIVTRGTSALLDFTSPETLARLEELAAHEPSGPLRFGCLRVVIGRGSKDAVPTLLRLTEDRDPRVRAMVVRALRRHVAEPDVVERLAACCADACWQVRRGAYGALSAAPPDKAIPPLTAALETETGDQRRRVERHLKELGKGDGPPAAKPGAFGLPFTSRRVLFVLDLPRHGADTFGYVRTEMADAISALPDGALFEVVALTAEKQRFAPRPLKANPATRRRAIAWIGKLKPSGPSNTTRLFSLISPEYEHPTRGARRFLAMPDAIYLICDNLEAKQTTRGFATFALWNSACDAVLHACAVGKVAVPPDLPRFVEASGGTFTQKEDSE